MPIIYFEEKNNTFYPGFFEGTPEELPQYQLENGKTIVAHFPAHNGEYNGHDHREVPLFSFQQMVQAIKVLKEEELNSLTELMELNHYAHSCLNDCCRFDAVGWLADVGRDSRDLTSDSFVQSLWDFLIYDQQRKIVCAFLEGVIGIDNVPVERVEALFNLLHGCKRKISSRT